jgi:4-hydroxy-3-methylbut-2-en-1-yl diphosphate reductase
MWLGRRPATTRFVSTSKGVSYDEPPTRKKRMKVLLASPHGFCAGVVMATRCLEQALELLGPPLFVYHEIVHNRHVVEQFQSRGVVFVDDLEDVPRGANLLFSAHGVSPQVRQLARQRQLHVIDATCPLVAKVHMEARRYAAEGYCIVLIGHAGHDEIIGLVGEADEQIVLVETPEDVDRLQLANPDRVAYLTQTTLSVDDAKRIVERLKGRFPNIVAPAKDDICYATQNRQDAVRQLAGQADLVIVLGSPNSSNANRLVEVAVHSGTPGWLIDGPDALDVEAVGRYETILLTAGASTPEHVVRQCLHWFQDHFGAEIEERNIRQESVQFPLPKVLLALQTTEPHAPSTLS